MVDLGVVVVVFWGGERELVLCKDPIRTSVYPGREAIVASPPLSRPCVGAVVVLLL